MRYAVTLDFYIHADNDQQAIEKAQKIAQKRRDKHDDYTNVLEIHETPFASMHNRKLIL